MVKHNIYSNSQVVNKFNRFSKFLLIGNKIDGYVDFDIKEFENFEDVKLQLPEIIRHLDFAGEWSLRLYQVPYSYSINKLYGYYRVPSKSILIFDFDYMLAGQENELIISNKILHFTIKCKVINENWDDKKDHWDFELYEEYLTIMLNEDIDGKEYKNHKYPGDIGLLEKSIYETVETSY